MGKRKYAGYSATCWLNEEQRDQLKAAVKASRFDSISDYIADRLGFSPRVRVRRKDGDQGHRCSVPGIKPFRHDQGLRPVLHRGVHSCQLDNIHRHSIADSRPYARGALVMFSVREYPNGRWYGSRYAPHQLHLFNDKGMWLCTIRSGENFDYYADDFVDIDERFKNAASGEDLNPSEYMSHLDVVFRSVRKYSRRNRAAGSSSKDVGTPE